MNENISIKEGGITRKFSPIDKVKVNNTEWIATSELDTSPLTKPIPFGKLIHRTGTYHSGGRYWEHHTWISGGEAAIAYGSNNFHYLIASSQPGSYTTENYSFTIDDKEPIEQSSSSSAELDQTYTANGKTVYYKVGTNSFVDLKNAELYPTVNAYFYNSSHHGEIAWTLIYGEIKEEASVEVPVDFIRDDGEVLEDTFTITVGLDEDSGGGDSGGGGNDSPDIADYQLNNQDVVGLYYDSESKKVIAPNIGEYTVNQAIDIGLLIPKKNKKPWESD